MVSGAKHLSTTGPRRYAFESTVETLATCIRLGEFGPGQRLPAERDLAARLGVSRSTLREALDALRTAGLVATTRGRCGGTAVVPAVAQRGPACGAAGGPNGSAPSTAISDLLIFRRVLEPGVASQAACVTLDDAQRDALLKALDDALHPGEDSARRAADTRLHLALAALTGSPMLLDAVTRVHRELHRHLAEIPALRVNLQHSATQHRYLVEAVLKGDAERARLVMQEHCDATAALVRGLLA